MGSQRVGHDWETFTFTGSCSRNDYLEKSKQSWSLGSFNLPFQPSETPGARPRPINFLNTFSFRTPSKAFLRSCPLEIFVKLLTSLKSKLLITTYIQRLLWSLNETSVDISRLHYRLKETHTRRTHATCRRQRRPGSRRAQAQWLPGHASYSSEPTNGRRLLGGGRATSEGPLSFQPRRGPKCVPSPKARRKCELCRSSQARRGGSWPRKDLGCVGQAAGGGGGGSFHQLRAARWETKWMPWSLSGRWRSGVGQGLPPFLSPGVALAPPWPGKRGCPLPRLLTERWEAMQVLVTASWSALPCSRRESPTECTFRVPCWSCASLLSYRSSFNVVVGVWE